MMARVESIGAVILSSFSISVMGMLNGAMEVVASSMDGARSSNLCCSSQVFHKGGYHHANHPTRLSRRPCRPYYLLQSQTQNRQALKWSELLAGWRGYRG